MQVKHCPKCNEDKPLEEFARNRARPDGLQSWCRACRSACQRKYRENHPETRSYSIRWRAEHPEQARAQEREYRAKYLEANRDLYRAIWLRGAAKLRAVIFDHYGRACACCGATERLNIDHIDGNGREHREEIGSKGGAGFYRWLIRNGFPEGFQTLCFPCNRSKGAGEACRIDHTKAVAR